MYSVNVQAGGLLEFLDLESDIPGEEEGSLCPFHEPVVISKDTRPLRLIDVFATLGYDKGAGFGAEQYLTPPKAVSFIAHPQDWDFHIISHTWSRAIRDLSDTVGGSLALNAPDHDQGHDDIDYDRGLQYNYAFQKVDFSREEGYRRLIEFLLLLAKEGVHRVWFDALCINQADKKEKEREIKHMGSYYKHSVGCYVVTHGFGKGYQLLGKNEDEGDGADVGDGDEEDLLVLPRWFSRVWTLQEFLLPTQLAFLVDMANDKHVIFLLNDWINEFSPSGFFCHCCLQAFSTEVPCRNMEKMVCTCCRVHLWECPFTSCALKILESSVASQKCVRCDSIPLIRGAGSHHPQLDRHSHHQHYDHLYFVERDAYPALLLLHRFHSLNSLGSTEVRNFVSNSGHLLPHLHIERWKWHCLQLFVLLKRKCYVCNAWGLSDLIRSRDCSVEEDRLLSILCLLGLDGKFQVRTGKSLEAQWIAVAPTLAKLQPKLLLQFCIQDLKGAWLEGVSWIPNYKNDGQYCRLMHGRSSLLSLNHCDVELKGLHHEMSTESAGALRLQGKVVASRLLPLKWQWQQIGCRCASCQHFNLAHLHRPRLHQKQSCCLQVKDALSISLSAHVFLEMKESADTTFIDSYGCYIQLDPSGTDTCLDCEESHNGGMHLPLVCMHELLPLDVSLILWGSSTKRVNGEFEPSSVVMICIGRAGVSPGHFFHKIGVLNLTPDVVNAIFGDVTARVEFVLGGFGSHHKHLWKVLGALYGLERSDCELHEGAHRDKVSKN